LNGCAPQNSRQHFATSRSFLRTLHQRRGEVPHRAWVGHHDFDLRISVQRISRSRPYKPVDSSANAHALRPLWEYRRGLRVLPLCSGTSAKRSARPSRLNATTSFLGTDFIHKDRTCP